MKSGFKGKGASFLLFFLGGGRVKRTKGSKASFFFGGGGVNRTKGSKASVDFLKIVCLAKNVILNVIHVNKNAICYV